jgi:membrane-bound ClpP family serine protease
MDFLFAHPAALAALALGYVLLVFEFCIPGFGVPGILGSILAVIGIIAMQPTPLQALIVVAVYVVLLAAALVICLRSTANGRLSKSRLVLNEQAVSKQPASPAAIIGKTGTACTPLRPAGIAEIDGKRMNVVTEGDFIDAGEKIRVASAEGNRIVVLRS